MARRWWWAPSTRTRCRRRPSRASASWRWRERSYGLLTEKYGIAPEDIIIDPLVFPCATGDANYIGAAVETIEGIRLVKEKVPFVKTVLGISNISFGLPAAAREVVNSVFLYYCTKAGLDLAIVNAEKLERFASIPEDERRLAENLLFNSPPVDAPRRSAAHRARRLAAAEPGREGRHQPVPHRRRHRPFPQGRARARSSAPKTCRSISAWPTTSSKAPRTGWSPISIASGPKAPRRSTSSTVR